MFTREQLKRGDEFVFTTPDEEDPRDALVYFHPKKKEFRLWFNGELIYSGKRFPAFLKRFEELRDKWNLQ